MIAGTKLLLFAVMVFALVSVCAPPVAGMASKPQAKDYPIQPVPFTDVRIEEGFWKPRLETNRKVTIPHTFKQMEEMGIVDNFAIAGRLKKGSFKGRQYHDSEFFKVIEGASYTLALAPDAELEKYLSDVIIKIAAAQEDDGYLYTWRTVDPNGLNVRRCGKTRWSYLTFSHELYNVGHLYEAAIAYYQATGKRSLLDVSLKNAELIDSVFGPTRKRAAPGHPEIEIGLAKLFRVTGDDRYLRLAKFFIGERGHPHGRELYGEKRQDHKSVLEQAELVGHAVRAGYLYSGMADVAALTGDSSYIRAIDRLWENVVSKKLYLTGGIGARHKNEAFGNNYELPNKTAYNETCAAIANVMWNHRLFLIHGDAKYVDVLERVLYNGFLSGVSLTGDKFFYCNPLEADGKFKFNKGWATRFTWSPSMCCPTNVTRFIPSLPGYIYAVGDNVVYVNLFVSGSGELRMKNNTVVVKQKTNYPWDGKVKIIIEPGRAAKFSVYVRVPGWARNRPVPSDLYHYMQPSSEAVTLKVDGKTLKLDTEKGFACVKRVWETGDTIELDLPMPVRRVLCNEKVKENIGKVALERGPLVYCVEGTDNGGTVSHLSVEDNEQFESEYRKDMLGGMNIIRSKQKGWLAIPYYGWSHRGVGEMAVWLRRGQFALDVEASKVAP